MGKPQTKNKPIVTPTEIIEDEIDVEGVAVTEAGGDAETISASNEETGDAETVSASNNHWPAPEARPVTTLVTNLPVAKPEEYPEGGAQSKRISHVDLQLSRRQAEALRFLFCGIDQLPHPCAS